MNSTLTIRKRVLRTVLAVNLLVVSTFWIGCGPEGAGTIHVDPGQLKKKMAQPDASAAEAAPASPGPGGKSEKFGFSTDSKTRVSKKR
jgi:hypothetical protein